MNELTYVYGTLSLMVGAFAIQVLTKKFDPFAPIWLAISAPCGEPR